MESLPPGDQLARSKQEEVEEEEEAEEDTNAITGARASVWGVNEQRHEERELHPASHPVLPLLLVTDSSAADVSG